MGTRSNTVVIDGRVKIINMYRQFDGYPSGHGKALAKFLEGMEMCNGLSCGPQPAKIANGAGCLAAQMVAHFKNGAGGIYIENPRGKLDNDYAYILKTDTFAPEKGIKVEVMSGDTSLFKGSPEQFQEFCKQGRD